MEEENQEAQVEQVEQVAAPVEEPAAEAPEQKQQADDDAAFEAGFNAAAGQEPEEAPAVEPEPEPQEATFAGYKESEIKEMFEAVAALKQRESKIFGSMGALKQTIDSLRSQTQSAPVKLTPDSLKRLSKEFPEIAQMLAEDLSEALPSGGAAAPVNVDDIVEQKVQTRLSEASRALETRLLSMQHRDWQQVVQSPEFTGWKETLPEEVKTELDNSWDATFIGEKLSEFKEWRTKSTQVKQTNKQRLAAAVAPTRGTATVRPAQTETDAFYAGFKAVRG